MYSVQYQHLASPKQDNLQSSEPFQEQRPHYLTINSNCNQTEVYVQMNTFKDRVSTHLHSHFFIILSWMSRATFTWQRSTAVQNYKIIKKDCTHNIWLWRRKWKRKNSSMIAIIHFTAQSNTKWWSTKGILWNNFTLCMPN